MPKATTKSKHYNHQDKPNSFFDTVLDSFLKTGHFKLTNEIVTSEALDYFIAYLEQQPKDLNSRDRRVYLKNVTFNVGSASHTSEQAYREAQIEILLDIVFKFSSIWTVIAFDNVAILQDKNHYPLSSNFIRRFLYLLTSSEYDRAILRITHQLVIRNAEFHSWYWIKFLITRPRCGSLILELLNNDEQEDNLMVLFQALHYAKIRVLNLKNTELSLEIYQALNQLLSKNYFIEKIIVEEPTDPESLVIFKKINERLSKDATGQDRFNREKFNQDEFVRLFSEAKSALQHETDESKVKKLKKEFKFMLEQKKFDGYSIAREKDKLETIELIPKAHAVYYDHAEYILGRLPLFRLDLNRSIANQVNTLGYYLLEEALRNNDQFMMNCLLDNGTANLFEQQGDEKPILVQIYEKEAFKQAILDHIYSRKNLIRMAEEILKDYPKSKEIMVEMVSSLINYTKRLEKIIYSYKLSGFERLLNRLKERYELSDPSKQREQEFIEIYWRVGKSLILFHNAGNVTVQSISNAQSTQDEITAISKNADLGWLHGSKLHYKLTRRLDLLKKDMSKNIKKLSSELSELDEPGPSTRFSPRH